jgi:hypothetical protein
MQEGMERGESRLIIRDWKSLPEFSEPGASTAILTGHDSLRQFLRSPKVAVVGQKKRHSMF